MSAIEQAAVEVLAPTPVIRSADPETAVKRGLWFWIVRYLPAEISGTAAMVIAGLGVTFWTDNPAAIAAAALVGEIVGFYAVLAVVILLEQRRLTPGRRVAHRVLLLLVAEFGAAELFDTFLIRPVALLAGVWLLGDPVWGLLVGKVVADVIFYAIAAGAFTITDKTGLRRKGGQ